MLAIVIPAYKMAFLDEALYSIAKQTSKDFTLYIGDDNSPEDLYKVVERYQTQLKIVYKKFNENIGNRSIVQHWERCIALTENEDWIWLFSDDDIMAEDCVEQFYKAVEETKEKFDVYRFNCCIINAKGEQLSGWSQYPRIQTSYQFLVSRLTFQVHSYIVNYVFSRNVYVKSGGLVDFSAAWAADDATWVLFGQDKNIFTMENGGIMWRESLINISGNHIDPVNRKRKLKGAQQFIQWVQDWAGQSQYEIDQKLLMTWFHRMLGLIGFRKRFLVYIKSQTFRKYFWRRDVRHQFSLLRQNLGG